MLTVGSSGGFDAPPPQTSGRLRSRRRLEEVEQSRGVKPAKAGSARLPVKLQRLPCDFGAGARALGQLKSQTQVFPGEVDKEASAIVVGDKGRELALQDEARAGGTGEHLATVCRSTPRRSASAIASHSAAWLVSAT